MKDEIIKDVITYLDGELADCKRGCKTGMLSGEAVRFVVQTVLQTLDNWTPRLSNSMRTEILNWFESEYGLCL